MHLTGPCCLASKHVNYDSSDSIHSVQAVGRVDPDGSRYLLGDTLGNLHMLVLSNDGQRVVGLKLEALGRISTPSTLSYLDSGVVFVVSLQTCM